MKKLCTKHQAVQLCKQPILLMIRMELIDLTRKTKFHDAKDINLNLMRLLVVCGDGEY